jgi:hypothetical protein
MLVNPCSDCGDGLNENIIADGGPDLQLAISNDNFIV